MGDRLLKDGCHILVIIRSGRMEPRRSVTLAHCSNLAQIRSRSLLSLTAPTSRRSDRGRYSRSLLQPRADQIEVVTLAHCSNLAQIRSRSLLSLTAPTSRRSDRGRYSRSLHHTSASQNTAHSMPRTLFMGLYQVQLEELDRRRGDHSVLRCCGPCTGY